MLNRQAVVQDFKRTFTRPGMSMPAPANSSLNGRGGNRGGGRGGHRGGYWSNYQEDHSSQHQQMSVSADYGYGGGGGQHFDYNHGGMMDFTSDALVAVGGSIAASQGSFAQTTQAANSNLQTVSPSSGGMAKKKPGLGYKFIGGAGGTQYPKKRPLKDSPDLVKQKRQASILNDPKKNIVQKLYEIYGPECILVGRCEEEVLHDKISPARMSMVKIIPKRFTQHITVDGKPFKGTAMMKKDAKTAACEEAFKQLFPETYAALGKGAGYIKPDAQMQDGPASKHPRITSPTATLEKTPISILHEMLQPRGLTPTFEHDQAPGLPIKFRCVCTAMGRKFEGFATSKKVSKHNAAQEALSTLFDLTVNPVSAAKALSAPNEPDTEQKNSSSIPVGSARAPWSDVFSQLVVNKFDELTRGSPYAKYGVLAGIIMTTGDNYLKDHQLVTLATGTKGLGGNQISERGLVLRDCHAEVLCRRALLRYLYSQISVMRDPQFAADSIFECVDPNSKANKFRLKPNYHFHLFISSAPCGDGRVFSFAETGESVATNTERLNRGTLRFKIEAGQGTNPSESKFTQLWEAVAIGEPLRTMCCSDKIMMWNVVGIQGSLLSQYIEPIYFRSIIVDQLFNQENIERALIGRVPKSLTISPPFHLATPTISTTVKKTKREVKKQPDIALSWLICDSGIEVIDCVGGRLQSTKSASRLCSTTLYCLYTSLCTNLSESAPDDKKTYGATKSEVGAKYLGQKKQLIAELEKNNIGFWLTKPEEMGDFVSKAKVVP